MTLEYDGEEWEQLATVPWTGGRSWIAMNTVSWFCTMDDSTTVTTDGMSEFLDCDRCPTGPGNAYTHTMMVN